MKSNPDEIKAEVKAEFDKLFGDEHAIKAYITDHEELLRLEAKNAWDREAKPPADSTNDADRVERRAATIIRAVREYEREVIFGNLASEAIPGPDTRDMGGQYLTNKHRIDHESELHQIAIKVPKGALLHLHFNSELHPERLLVHARTIKNLYIRSIRPLLTQEDLNLTEMVFNVLDGTKDPGKVDIFSPQYEGNATNFKNSKNDWIVWMPWEKFQNDFERHFPGKYKQSEATKEATCCSEPHQVPLRPAEVWLKSKMVLSQEEAYGFTQTVNGYVFVRRCSFTTDTITESGHASIRRPDASKAYSTMTPFTSGT